MWRCVVVVVDSLCKSVLGFGGGLEMLNSKPGEQPEQKRKQSRERAFVVWSVMVDCGGLGPWTRYIIPYHDKDTPATHSTGIVLHHAWGQSHTAGPYAAPGVRWAYKPGT